VSLPAVRRCPSSASHTAWCGGSSQHTATRCSSSNKWTSATRCSSSSSKWTSATRCSSSSSSKWIQATHCLVCSGVGRYARPGEPSLSAVRSGRGALPYIFVLGRGSGVLGRYLATQTLPYYCSKQLPHSITFLYASGLMVFESSLHSRPHYTLVITAHLWSLRSHPLSLRSDRHDLIL